MKRINTWSSFSQGRLLKSVKLLHRLILHTQKKLLWANDQTSASRVLSPFSVDYIVLNTLAYTQEKKTSVALVSNLKPLHLQLHTSIANILYLYKVQEKKNVAESKILSNWVELASFMLARSFFSFKKSSGFEREREKKASL